MKFQPIRKHKWLSSHIEFLNEIKLQIIFVPFALEISEQMNANNTSYVPSFYLQILVGNHSFRKLIIIDINIS